MWRSRLGNAADHIPTIWNDIFFDEETTYFCWLPVDTQGRSFFDTEESALCAAKEDARLYCKTNPDRALFLEDARKEVINDKKEQ